LVNSQTLVEYKHGRYKSSVARRQTADTL